GDLKGLADGEASALHDPGAQRLALDELHGEVDAVLVLALVEDADDVAVGEAGGGARLPSEATAEVLVHCEMGMHDLQGHDAVQPLVVPAVHGRHSAARDRLLDPVAVVEEQADAGGSRRRRAHVSESMGRGAPGRGTTHAARGTVTGSTGCAGRRSRGTLVP